MFVKYYFRNLPYGTTTLNSIKISGKFITKINEFYLHDKTVKKNDKNDKNEKKYDYYSKYQQIITNQNEANDAKDAKDANDEQNTSNSGIDIKMESTNYINYVKTQEITLNSIEQKKEDYKNTYFSKDIKDNSKLSSSKANDN